MTDTVPTTDPTLPPISRGGAKMAARTNYGAPFADRLDVDAMAGGTLATLDAHLEARRRLLADVERCRYVVVPGHVCVNRSGNPVRGDQQCWAETRTALLEERLSSRGGGGE